MKKILFLLFALLIAYCMFGQNKPIVQRSSPSVTAVDARWRASMTMGIPIASDTTLNGGLDYLGSMVYRTTDGHIYQRDTTPGGHKWTKLLKQADAWSLTGNAGTVDGTNFIGTTDNIPLSFRVNNESAGYIQSGPRNTAFGYKAGLYSSDGEENTAMGWQSLMSMVEAYANTAVGAMSLINLQTGERNVGVGRLALPDLIAGNDNTVFGQNSGAGITNGSGNTILGANVTGLSSTLTNNVILSTGAGNIVGRVDDNGNSSWGLEAGKNNAGGSMVAVGYQALLDNSGQNNTAVGVQAMFGGASGASNTAIGHSSLAFISTGNNNTSLGYQSGYSLGSGSANIFIGIGAGNGILSGSNNTIIGSNITSLSSSLSSNIILADGTGNIRQQFDASGNLNIDLQSSVSDTTTYKPWVQGASGNIRRMSYWPGSGMTITASNGLTFNTATNVRWYGSLDTNTRINAGSLYDIIISGSKPNSSTTAIFQVSNTGSLGGAIWGQSVDGRGVYGTTNTFAGVYGLAITSGTGVFASSNSGNGLYAQSTSGLGADITVIPTSTNTVVSVANFARYATLPGANGIGGSIDLTTITASGGGQVSNRIISKWTDATNATRTSQLEFWGVNNATSARKMAIAGSGAVTLDGYASGAISTSDTTSYLPLGINSSGNVRSLTYWPGGSGGGGGGSSDSGIVLYGTIYNKKTWSSLSDFTQSAATWSATSNKLRATNGTANFSNTLSYNYYTLTESWNFSARVIIGSVASHNGFAIGVNSANATASNVIGAVVFSGADAGKVKLYLGVSNTQYAVSTSALSFTTGDTVILNVSKEGMVVTVTATNSTATTAAVSTYVSYQFATAPALQNTGRFALWNLGGTGTFDVDSLSITSPEIKRADIYILGNSKTQGYYATYYATSFVGLLRKYMTVVNGGGGADKTAEMLLRIPEIIALRPRVVILADVMSNDKRAGVSSATSQANLAQMVTDLHAAGISVIISTPMYETSLDLSDQYTYIKNTYSADSVIDVFAPLRAVGSSGLSDGIHPNDIGHNIIANTILTSGKLHYAGQPNLTVLEGFSGQVPVFDNWAKAIGSESLYFRSGVLRVGTYFQAGANISYTTTAFAAGTVSGNPTTIFYASGSSANEKNWDNYVFGNQMHFRTVNDGVTGASDWLNITRSGTDITKIAFPFSTHKFLIGTETLNGSTAQLQVVGKATINGTVVGQFATADFSNYSSGIGSASTGQGQWFLRDTAGASNEKLWDAFSGTASFFIRAVSDNGLSASTLIGATRSGSTITTVSMPTGRVLIGAPSDDGSTKLQINGNALVNSIAFIGSISATDKTVGIGANALGWPYMYWRNLSGASDEKMWDWYLDGSGNSVLRAVNDAGSGANSIWTINRTGYVINYFEHHTKMRFDNEINIGNNTDQGAFTIQNTGGFFQSGAVRLNLGTVALGDIYYGDASGNLVRLAAGTNGQVLTLASGVPAWADATGGGSAYFRNGRSSYDTLLTNPGTDTFLIKSLNFPSAGAVNWTKTTTDSTVSYALSLDGDGGTTSYTPTLTSVTNITGTTSATCYYSRVGNAITVWGVIQIQATSAASSEIGIELPIASDISAAGQLGGSSVAGATSTACMVSGDATNNRAKVSFVAANTSNNSYSFLFTYKLSPP